MRTSSNKVCVFVPCYNCAKYVERMMDSLFAQTFQQFDVVMVDDGSTDKTYEIITRIAKSNQQVKVHRNEFNRGLGYTRNLMFKYCNDYKYVALMDADDLAPIDRLQIEYEYLENHEDVASVSGVFQEINEDDALGIIHDDGVRKCDEIKKAMLFKNPIPNGSTMFRMESLIKNDLRYREKFFCAQDYMFYSELIQKCKMIKLPYILLYYRMNEGNITTVSLKRKKERDNLLDEIHRFNFEASNLKMNIFERYFLIRGYRDTSSGNYLFKVIFLIVRKLYLFRHPEYKRFV